MIRSVCRLGWNFFRPRRITQSFDSPPASQRFETNGILATAGTPVYQKSISSSRTELSISSCASCQESSPLQMMYQAAVRQNVEQRA